MKNPVGSGHRPWIALVILVVLVSFAGGTVEAGSDGRGRWDHDHHHHGKYKKPKKHKGHDHYYGHGHYYYDGGGYSSAPPRFVVPHHLYRRDYGSYDRYYRGTTWYAPHRHGHRVYLFPVIVDGYHTEYRPYAYCGEAYYPDHYHEGGPRGHVGLHFDF